MKNHVHITMEIFVSLVSSLLVPSIHGLQSMKPLVSLIPRPSHSPDFDHLQDAKWWGEAWEHSSHGWCQCGQRKGGALNRKSMFEAFSCSVLELQSFMKQKSCCLLYMSCQRTHEKHTLCLKAPPLPSVYLGRLWRHLYDKCSQAPPPSSPSIA